MMTETDTPTKEDQCDESHIDNHKTQYLTFTLADEEYGVDILRVQEIRGWEVATRVPNAPSYVKGVLNLRGSIVPIFDLRERFELHIHAYTKDTVVVVLRVNGEAGMCIMGVVVDAVSDVLNAGHEGIVCAPDFGDRIATEFISGLVSAGGKMVMLLDVDKLLNQDKQEEVDKADAA
ncbi:Positive regulator of CheA protein activity (CheW) [hydrothermal vent metagenome]|uniref:Chemotaxis protein CheW n=1 Tax=hydrothermal vent metagenome TaxID=652676 RepID=A0A3B1AP51_9ZZZZ